LFEGVIIPAILKVGLCLQAIFKVGLWLKPVRKIGVYKRQFVMWACGCLTMKASCLEGHVGNFYSGLV
jgi:hypothetical protein